MMRAILGAIVVAGLLAGAAAYAQEKATAPQAAEKPVTGGADTAAAEKKPCDVPADLLPMGDNVLDKVAQAIKANKKLDVLVVGSGSSTLAGPDGVSLAYPARLEANLREQLPGIAVAVATSLQPKRTAEETAETLSGLVAEKKPDLLIWQTGTVDALRSIHPDDFRNAIDEGVANVKAAGADVMLMNLQYSPRIETMLPTSPYLDNIRAVAQQQDILLFDRYAIMHSWAENGVFDLSHASRSLTLAKGVHDCIGRALAGYVIAGAKVPSAEPRVQ
ncbi:Lipolytic enzyme [Afipia sp. P52-10]|uniref:SGNH/GDSL hydrolase family protein n=1 Tax=Afipia sp. P52-10 TaxID=1429916 RepID=UPI0003DF36AC|nr:SGNH/GDSL hydrolase family protein [Afipia sp. P52-10]ETR77261.1 Lipolytic enzyme [Afipia sp. P52-10]